MEPKIFKLLMVEDSPADADAVREALQTLQEPVELTVVRNGYHALDHLFRQQPFEGASRPDLILLDLNLPGLHGRQVLSLIKGDISLKTIPVVIFTSAWAPETVADCRQLADGYIVKPKTWTDCVDQVRMLVRQFVRRDPPQAEASAQASQRSGA